MIRRTPKENVSGSMEIGPDDYAEQILCDVCEVRKHDSISNELSWLHYGYDVESHDYCPSCQSEQQKKEVKGRKKAFFDRELRIVSSKIETIKQDVESLRKILITNF
jgi:wobble nucleotide-excising tRNase